MGKNEGELRIEVIKGLSPYHLYAIGIWKDDHKIDNYSADDKKELNLIVKRETKERGIKGKPTFELRRGQKAKRVNRTGRLISHSGRTTRQHRGSVIR